MHAQILNIYVCPGFVSTRLTSSDPAFASSRKQPAIFFRKHPFLACRFNLSLERTNETNQYPNTFPRLPFCYLFSLRGLYRQKKMNLTACWKQTFNKNRLRKKTTFSWTGKTRDCVLIFDNFFIEKHWNTGAEVNVNKDDHVQKCEDVT